jgi:hypothetical protein
MQNTLKSAILVGLFVSLAACDGSPESKARLRAISQASCAMSMHCNPADKAAGGTGYSNYSAPVASSAPVGNIASTRPLKQILYVSWNAVCPTTYQGAYYQRHQSVGGNKQCQYG